MSWFVYILRCADDSLYTGVTTDLERRVKEHNGEGGKGKGAKYTKVRRPVTLAYSEKAKDRSSAQVRESAIRKFNHVEKLTLVSN